MPPRRSAPRRRRRLQRPPDLPLAHRNLRPCRRRPPEGTLLEPPALRSLRHYSVEIEGDSILVDPAPMNHPTLAAYNSEAPAPALHPERHIVTIGGGAAAAAAVTALRQGGFAGRLTVIDPILNEPVDRTNLSKMTLAGKKPADTLPLWSPEERANLRVDRLEASVTALDGTAGTLTTSTGQALQFDAALFAPVVHPKRSASPAKICPMSSPSAT
nr:FAD-dependent oxidoreductase [Acidipila sp. EB88]